MHPWTLFFEGTEAETHALEALFEETALCCSRFEKKGTSPLVWTFEGLFSTNPLKDPNILSLIETSLCGRERFTSAPLPDKDWIAENRASFNPIEVGRFLIHPSSYSPPKKKEQICFEVNASFAFGTGSHATTQGCLELLETLSSRPFNKILDLGCGTGILAMAAARLFPKASIDAADNDPEAVVMTEQNLLQNQLENHIQFHLSEGFAAEPLAKEPYDLILANILAQPLIELSHDMALQTSPRAFLILSGLLQTQEKDVVDAYKKEGFVLNKTCHRQEWSALLLQKVSPQ